MRQQVFGAMVVALALVAANQVFLVAGQHEGHGGGISNPMPAREVAKTGKSTGKVVSVNQASITIEVQKKGQPETLSFLITEQTKTKGEIAVGTEVKVKYREEMAVKTATSIEVGKTKKT